MKHILKLLAVFVFFTACVAVAEEEIYDPWEPYNRRVFEFNDVMDEYVAEPVARGYDYVMPDFAKKGITNFFRNLSYPKYVVSDLIQLKFGQMLKHTGRFIINTTLGIGGLFDVAEEFGLEHHYEDIGVALAYQGVPAGPYWVMPFLGPTTLRDGIGRIIEFFISPWYWFDDYTNLSWEWDWGIPSAATALDFIDTRYGLLEAGTAAKESAVDYYLFMQSAYYQYRDGLVKDEYISQEELESAADDEWLLAEDEEF